MAISKPVVSVVVITYNQEKYIEQALNSILGQVTDFPFEVVISDDASTDTTQALIKKYEKKFPGIINFIAQKKNLGAQKNFVFALQQAKGTYVALCDGDDFWTDTSKLQRQVDFMKAHPDYALCFHPVTVFFEGSEDKNSVYPDTRDASKFTLRHLLERNFIQTNSVLYKRKNYETIPTDIIPGDWYLHLYHAQDGKIGFINRVMSSYRRHDQGIWWTEKGIDAIWIKHGLKHVAMYEAIRDIYKDAPVYRTIIESNQNNLMGQLAEIDIKQGTQLVLDVAQVYADVMTRFALFMYDIHLQHDDEKNRLVVHGENLQAGVEDRDKTIASKVQEIEALNLHLETIKSSRAWRLRNKLAKVVGKDPI